MLSTEGSNDKYCNIILEMLSTEYSNEKYYNLLEMQSSEDSNAYQFQHGTVSH